MTSTLVTTPVARFHFDHMASRFGEGRFPLESYTRMYTKSHPDHRVEMWDERGRRVWHYGPVDVKPRIWTHTPVPHGMPIEKVHARFEERAASILGDWDTPVSFATGACGDNRYKDITVRTAWMMYLDRAVEEYLTRFLH